jgi:cell division inhibitor SulA
VGSLTEILPTLDGIGELRLTVPTLTQLTRSGKYAALIGAPYLPYPPALAQQGLMLDKLVFLHDVAASLWAGEQMLRCSAFGAVLLWHPSPTDKELRRLQLAAEAGGTLAFLYRPPAAARASSPAALRMLLHATQAAARIEIFKCRGGRPGQSVQYELSPAANTSPAARAA